MKPITSTGHDGRKWLLIDEVTRRSVKEGEVLKDFRGDADTIVGGAAPHKPSSTGRVYVESGASFYPSVFGLVWTRV